MIEKDPSLRNPAVDREHPYAYYPGYGNALFAAPIEDIHRITFCSPESLRRCLKVHPVDKNFVDWFAALGGQIIYRTMEANGGAIFWPEIWVKPSNSRK